MSALYDKLLREAAQQRTLPKRRPPNGGLPSRAPDRVSNRPVHPACAPPDTACTDLVAAGHWGTAHMRYADD